MKKKKIARILSDGSLSLCFETYTQTTKFTLYKKSYKNSKGVLLKLGLKGKKKF